MLQEILQENKLIFIYLEVKGRTQNKSIKGQKSWKNRTIFDRHKMCYIKCVCLYAQVHVSPQVIK